MLKNDSLDLLHEDMRRANMVPTWKYISEFVSREPRQSYRPWLWKWGNVLPLLERAGDLITPERGAERRSMEHLNPDLAFSFSASHTLASALQLVRAGERAPAHRHMASAIRFAAKSKGGAVYTQVQGEKLRMEENDLILTPSWSWHEHANETEHDIVWLDALDFPLVNLMQASVFEPGEAGEGGDRPADFSERRLSNYRPMGWGDYPDDFSVYRYPWEDMHAALMAERGADGSPFDGILMEYTDPKTGGSTLPTMSCRAQLLRQAEATKAHRTISSTIYYVISGSGSTVIEGSRFEWGPGDVFVVPNWHWHEHVNGDAESLLFSVTDEPVMRCLGMFREQQFPDNAGHQEVTGTFEG